MSSANRERRKQNREARMVAIEESLRRSRRQRVMLTAIGLGLAVVVGVVLVARAHGNGGKSAASTTTTTAADTTTTAGSTTTSTTLPSAAGKPCVAEVSPAPAGTPAVPVPAGPPPKQLVKLDIKVGTGAVVKPGSTVTVNSVGVACSTGKVFDSTYGKQPYTQPVAALIKGWAQGIPGMKVGGERLLGVPPDLAYGATSPQGSGLAPNETLWYVVDLLKTT